MLGLKKSLFLLGAFAIGYNLAIAIHELGHASAMWATGGTVSRITLNPFSRSYTYYGSLPTHPLLTAWAGVGLSCVVGLLFLVCFWKLLNQWTLPLMLTGLCAILVNGLYLTVDAVMLSGGDATYLIRHGVSRLLVLFIGGSLIVLGIGIGYLLLHRMGLADKDGILARLAILEGGVGPYLIAMLVYQIRWNRGEIMEWFTYVMAGIVILAGIAVGSILIERCWSFPQRHSISEPSWPMTIGLLVVAAICLTTEFLVYGE